MNNLYEDGVYMDSDNKAIRILDQFLPDRIFDAHAHIHSDIYAPDIPSPSYGATQYKRDMCPVFGSRQIDMNMIPFPYLCLKDRQNLNQSDHYLME